jgi:POT family proton-dependent oligopeptide transporter
VGALFLLRNARAALLLPGHNDVIGLGAVRGVLESLFGPLGVQPFASQIYGLYTGFVYLTPLFGGWLADHVLGQRCTVILGAALMAVGHFIQYQAEIGGYPGNVRLSVWRRRASMALEQ